MIEGFQRKDSENKHRAEALEEQLRKSVSALRDISENLLTHSDQHRSSMSEVHYNTSGAIQNGALYARDEYCRLGLTSVDHSFVDESVERPNLACQLIGR